MELKAFLPIPYTVKERLDFIVEQNHTNGYEIRETSKGIEAWGDTTEEIQEKEKQQLINDLIHQLDEIDLKTVRPLRAIQSEQGTPEDQQKLNELESQAKAIRERIRSLQESEEEVEIEEENNI